MSRPQPREHSSHARVFSELHIGSHPVLPIAANDAGLGRPYDDAAADERTSDPAFRARFWRIGLPALGLFWASVAGWVLS